MTDSHTKYLLYIFKGLQKKVWKTVISMEFIKSRAHYLSKTQHSGKEVKLDLLLIMTDSHTKTQLNIFNGLQKSAENLWDGRTDRGKTICPLNL